MADILAYYFPAGCFDVPNNADWAVNALAPLDVDDANNAYSVMAFDDTIEEGVGFEVGAIPSGKTNIKISLRSKAKAAGGAARTVGLKMYFREMLDNGAIQSWSSYVLSDIDIPDNVLYQFDTQTVTLATFGLTVGRKVQFEVTRVTPGAGTDLTGDWFLKDLVVEFT